ncbi:flavin reductase like domain-containing protein [Lentinula edodes]|nr:flavin reductase like domain-containing protein [Lentinula edodes]
MLARDLQRHIVQRAHLSTATNNEVKKRLRSLLRESAQPVAVVTSLLHYNDTSPHDYHGATLSSFSSIALDPYPLVAFSLRIPSRMATSLRSAPPNPPSDMVVNILSATQAPTAVLFSRPDLHPNPFQEVGFTLNSEGIPVLEGCLGAISCKLATNPMLLDDPRFSGEDFEKDSRSGDAESENEICPASITSELFIARVTNIERLALDEADTNDPQTMPLLYHRRNYLTCSSKYLLDQKP